MDEEIPLLRKLSVITAAMLAFASLAGQLTTHADATHANPFAYSARFDGVRWKPGLKGQDVLMSRAPYVGKFTRLALADRVSNAGASYATIDVSPDKKVWKTLSDNTTDGYTSCDGTFVQGGTPSSACQADIDDWQRVQREWIADFLADLGANPLRFFLHARVNSEAEFTTNMIQTLRQIKSRGYLYKIRGIMIGEHERPYPWASDATGYLNKALRIAADINAADLDTSTATLTGWLKSNDLTLHGGRFGADFNDITNGVKMGTTNRGEFFTRVALQSDSFAFAFKYFDGGNRFDTSAVDTCGGTAACWESFLRNADESEATYTDYVEGLNLDGLQSTLNAMDDNPATSTVDPLFTNIQDYTNVIFVGDSADGLYNLQDRPNLIQALKNVFARKCWNGFLFGQPVDYRDSDGLNDSTEVKRGMWKDDPALTSTTGKQAPLDWWNSWSAAVNAAQPTPCS